jgi:hypothetical protein
LGCSFTASSWKTDFFGSIFYMNGFRLFLSLACGLCGLATSVQGQWTQQIIPLRPGWNAVFLEVHPSPANCDELFAGLPVESVWDWNRQRDSAQFLQDPTSLIPGAPGWLTWFPPGHPLASQASLFILRDGRPYLIKMADNASPVTWTVKGTPSLRRIVWRPDEVNFVGFPVGTPGPTFQALFAGENGLAGQPVYALDSTGVWQAVTSLSTTRPVAGQAYWVRCRLPAQRTGTIEVDPGTRQGLIFQEGVAEASLRVRNTSASARNITVRLLPSVTPPAGQPPLAGPVPLEYWKADYANIDLGWKTLPTPLTFTGLPIGSEWTLRLGVRRPTGATATPGSAYQGLLEVHDDLGTRWLVPIRAEARSGALAPAGLRPADGHGASVHAGLWVGEAVLNAVSQPAHPTNPTATRPAGGEFPFRLIVHVDAIGTARLLQHSYLVRKPPLLAPDPENPGFNIVIEPARAVVVTDESLIAGLVGTGEVSGRRMSSAAFGFNQPLALTGALFGAGTITGTVTLGYNDPTNPFKHLYHPDHNNLDERFEQTLSEGRESFTVTRQISLEFNGQDPLGLDPPGWGDSEIGGIYRETFTGLHRDPIRVGGTFRLTRVARVPDLDDSSGGGFSRALLAR